MSKNISISGRESDLDPWRYACKNGIINLKLGEIRDGLPSQYITKHSPVKFIDLNDRSPMLEKFLREVFRDDLNMIEYLQRLLGYAMTGLTSEHIIPVLWGPAGRNAKSTLIHLIQYVMGDMAGPIRSEMLLSQPPSRSSGPSPDIMRLKGLRMAFAMETDEGKRFSPARVKWLSGGDMLVGRPAFGKEEIAFKPSHTLFLCTNNKPHAPASDAAFWERVHLIPFRVSFVRRDPQGPLERPADIYILDKLKQEASGVLAWLVRGCLAWQELGLNPPDSVLEATREYRREEDFLSDWIEEKCVTNY